MALEYAKIILYNSVTMNIKGGVWSFHDFYVYREDLLLIDGTDTRADI